MTHAGYTGPLCRRVTIRTLPDEAHLEIFSFYVDQLEVEGENIEAWITLVHVCQRWRNVVFVSSHRLNLRLMCTGDRPVRKMLDIWPALPISLFDYRPKSSKEEGGATSLLRLSATIAYIKLSFSLFRVPSSKDTWQ